ncbi:MAG: hypothetical protein WCB04_15465, partial [Mycobacteriales bacterium]
MRPLLLPALRRLWRDVSTIQLGVDPARAVIVGDLPPGAAALLDRLDGTADLEDVLQASARDGLDHTVGKELVDMLVRANAVVDAGRLTPVPSALDARTRHRLAPDIASLSLTADLWTALTLWTAAAPVPRLLPVSAHATAAPARPA